MSRQREQSAGGDVFVTGAAASRPNLPTTPSTPEKTGQQRPPRFEFSLPHAHGLVNRYVTSTLGTLGRFKRMIGSRSAAAGQQAVGDLELEPNETGDLLYVKGDLEAYLEVSGVGH
jgi:hypothetical protein